MTTPKILRPSQVAPVGDWYLWALMGGRGSGKTLAGATWLCEHASLESEGPLLLAIVARDYIEAEEVLIFGASGIMEISPESFKPEYFPSEHKLVWPNGNKAFIYSSDDPEALRGPEFHYAWGDEAAHWLVEKDSSGLTALQNLMLCTRLGTRPRICLTMTPTDGHNSIARDISERAKKTPESYIITHMSTQNNEDNLSRQYLAYLYDLYEGTELADTELHGRLGQNNGEESS